MSLDANYIFVYDEQSYVAPTPMDKDREYLDNKFGGYFLNVEETTIYWNKPKYTLPSEEYEKLYADQILERKDCEIWAIVK